MYLRMHYYMSVLHISKRAVGQYSNTKTGRRYATHVNTHTHTHTYFLSPILHLMNKHAYIYTHNAATH